MQKLVFQTTDYESTSLVEVGVFGVVVELGFVVGFSVVVLSESNTSSLSSDSVLCTFNSSFCFVCVLICKKMFASVLKLTHLLPIFRSCRSWCCNVVLWRGDAIRWTLRRIHVYYRPYEDQY